MKISAVRLYENGFMTQPFAFGGEEGMEAFDPTVKFPSSLQNYVIEVGDEVILVDTGMPKESPETPRDENALIYMGSKVDDYVTGLEKLGYKPEQVTKILVTHKHADHTGELRSFPNAKIYLEPEDVEAMKLDGANVIPASYSDGAYYNFPAAEKIVDGVYFIKAQGHTKGNSIVIAEDDGIFYMFHGDVTYTDEALLENKLSIVFEDKDAARATLDMVREFIQNHPTVYLSTHTPLGISNLVEKKIMSL